MAELSLITLHWFLTAFASVVHIRLLLRIWDLFFYEGSLVLFQTTLGMLRLKVLTESPTHCLGHLASRLRKESMDQVQQLWYPPLGRHHASPAFIIVLPERSPKCGCAWGSSWACRRAQVFEEGTNAMLPNSPTPQEEELIQSENSASIFNTLSDIPAQMEDAELLLGEAMRLAGSLTDVAVETQRRKHLAYLIADQGQTLGTSATTNLSQVG